MELFTEIFERQDDEPTEVYRQDAAKVQAKILNMGADLPHLRLAISAIDKTSERYPASALDAIKALLLIFNSSLTDRPGRDFLFRFYHPSA